MRRRRPPVTDVSRTAAILVATDLIPTSALSRTKELLCQRREEPPTNPRPSVEKAATVLVLPARKSTSSRPKKEKTLSSCRLLGHDECDFVVAPRTIPDDADVTCSSPDGVADITTIVNIVVAFHRERVQYCKMSRSVLS